MKSHSVSTNLHTRQGLTVNLTINEIKKQKYNGVPCNSTKSEHNLFTCPLKVKTRNLTQQC